MNVITQGYGGTLTITQGYSVGAGLDLERATLLLDARRATASLNAKRATLSADARRGTVTLN